MTSRDAAHPCPRILDTCAVDFGSFRNPVNRSGSSSRYSTHPIPPHTTYPTLHAMYSIRNGWDLGLRHPQHTNSFQSFSVLRTASSLDAAFSSLLITHAPYLVHLSLFLFVLPGYILKESNVSIASTPIDWNVPVTCRNIKSQFKRADARLHGISST